MRETVPGCRLESVAPSTRPASLSTRKLASPTRCGTAGGINHKSIENYYASTMSRHRIGHRSSNSESPPKIHQSRVALRALRRTEMIELRLPATKHEVSLREISFFHPDRRAYIAACRVSMTPETFFYFLIRLRVQRQHERVRDFIDRSRVLRRHTCVHVTPTCTVSCLHIVSPRTTIRMRSILFSLYTGIRPITEGALV